MTMTPRTLALVALLLAACGGAKDAAPAGDAAPAAPAGPAPTGKVIEIQMITDGTSNRFEPAEIEAHPGDVLRFTLQVGVHNVHFLADSNPGIPNLPPASDMLQLPGQTVDVIVNFPVGKTIYFQCDPHALLGMVGHVKIES
ncbi:MAG: hypothetical protein IPP98_05755 [Gemmatimonadetes bacterium]|nr:hypothetical protein [Gemmatimonadota bacterium]